MSDVARMLSRMQVEKRTIQSKLKDRGLSEDEQNRIKRRTLILNSLIFSLEQYLKDEANDEG
jgi:hypothetical protein